MCHIIKVEFMEFQTLDQLIFALWFETSHFFIAERLIGLPIPTAYRVNQALCQVYNLQ